MDKIMQIIETLAQRAKDEVTPKFDVSDEVITQIALMQRSRNRGLLPLELFAGFTAVAASIMLFLTIHAVENILNPMSQLLAPYQGASLW
ncbi:MAG: hypothetical protein A2Y12_07185 [Planctomycetes bacterium GWF2_42_9]|nr:MAG: hypothetical protein A2Y12_07185 [Planctomycetes bacterium GWF2_42_9]HAL45567.1 hypothetical protein [Phycisphaerales bacterium]